MGIEQKKEIVRQVIIKAVPSVMDLKMGCEVILRIPWEGKMKVVINDDTIMANGINGIKFGDSDCYECEEIIGRPITLADVLVAIGKKKENDDDYNPILVSETGSFFLHDMDSSDIEGYELEHLSRWDLSQDYDHQSEQTIDFLWSLLCE